MGLMILKLSSVEGSKIVGGKRHDFLTEIYQPPETVVKYTWPVEPLYSSPILFQIHDGFGSFQVAQSFTPVSEQAFGYLLTIVS